MWCVPPKIPSASMEGGRIYDAAASQSKSSDLPHVVFSYFLPSMEKRLFYKWKQANNNVLFRTYERLPYAFHLTACAVSC